MQSRNIWSELWNKFWEKFMWPLVVGEIVVLTILFLRYILTLLHAAVNSHWFLTSFGYVGGICLLILFFVLTGYLTIHLFDRLTE